MALGTDFTYKVKTLFQMVMDEKDAKQVEDRMTKLSKEASEMSRKEFAKSFSSLGDEINKALAKLEMPPIDIKNILNANKSTDAFNALGAEFGKSFNEGLETALMQSGQIDKLIGMKQKELQQTQHYRYGSRSTAMRYATRQYDSGDNPMQIIKEEALSKFVGKDFSGLTEGDIYDYFDNLTTDINNASKILKDMPKTTPQDQQRVTQQVVAITDLYVRLFEGIRGLQQSSYSIDIAESAFKNARKTANTPIIGKNNIITEGIKSEYIGGLPMDTRDANLLITEILKLTTQSKFAAKSVEDVNAALNNLSSAKQSKRYKDTVQTLTDYESGKKANIQKAYTNVMQPTNADWVVQFQDMLKFIRAYENPVDPGTKEDFDIESLYKSVSAMREQIISSLKLFTDITNSRLNPQTGDGIGTGTGGGTGTGSGSGDGTGTGSGTGDGSGVTPEEVENANKLAEALQRVEAAYKELDALSDDPWNMKNEEEVNRILQERLAIIQRVGAENLKAHNSEWYDGVEYINNEYANRLDGFKELKDIAIYDQLNENFGYYNDVIQSSQELEVLLAKRKELMQGIHFDAEQEYLEQEQINQSIERRIALMKQLEPLVANGSITRDDFEEMVFEQGDLDERRNMLDGIQQNLINAEPEDLDEAQSVLDQYEKIMVETASGKKLTLGPEMSEADWKAFMRMDTERAKSIEFVRKEIQAHQENAAAINAETQAQEQLNGAETQNPKNESEIKKEAISYDELKKRVEAYIKVRQQMYSLMDQKDLGWTQLMPNVDAAKKDITSLFPETGDTNTVTSSMVGNILTNQDINEEHIKQLARALGIEIPQAAQQAKGAIDEVVGAQENLNNAESQNPPAQDDSEIHNANADAIKKEADETERLFKIRLNAMSAHFDALMYDQSVDDDSDFAQRTANEHKDKLLAKMGSDPSQTEAEWREWVQQTKNNMSPINEAVSRISKLSAVPKGLNSNELYQEAAKVGQQISTMYDEGITDTEEFIALQHKLLKIFDTIAHQYGGVKGAGFDDRFELNKAMYRNMKDDTGFDYYSGSLVDALYNTKNSIYDSDTGKRKTMRSMAADLLEYRSEASSGGLGFESDLFDLKQIEEILNIIEKRRAQLFQTQTPGTYDAEKQSVDGLNDSLEKKNAIENTDNDGAEVADENAKTEAIKQQNAALQENITLKGQANGQVVGGTGTEGTPVQTTPDGATSGEVTELEAVRAKVLEVTNAVNTKTQAFFAEQKAVKSIAQSEVHALGEVEKKVTAVRVALNNLQTKQHKINLSVAGGEDISNISATETQALTKLRAALQLTTKRVNEKTQAFETEKTVVNKVINSEIGALGRLNTQVDTVNKTVMNLLTNIQTAQTGMSNIVVPQAQPVTQNTNAKGQGSGGGGTSPQLLGAKIDTQFSSLSLMYAQLESVGKLTPEIEQQWLQLWDSLSKVNDVQSLQLWREQLTQVKNSMKEIMIANDLVEQEGVQSFQQLINVTKLYNQMLINSKKAKTSEERGVYEQEANAALVEQQRILQGITLTKEQQAQYDELEIERERQLNIIKAQQTGTENAKHQKQEEAIVVRELIDLYEQLGRARAQGDYTTAGDIRSQIKTERGKLSSVDRATDDKFAQAANRGEQSVANEANKAVAKAQNEALRERKKILGELIKLHRDLGVLEEKEKSSAVNDSKRQQYRTEIYDLYKQISAKEQLIVLTKEEIALLNQTHANAGRSARISNAGEREAEINKLKGQYAKLGEAQANAEHQGTNEARERFTVLAKEIAEKKTSLQLTQKELDLLRQITSESYKTQSGILTKKQQDKDFKEQIKDSQKTAGLTRSSSVATKAETTLTDAMSLEGISDSQVAKLEQYQSKIVSLQSLIKQLRSQGSLVTDAQKQELAGQTMAVDRYTKEIQELIANYERLSGPNAQSLNATSALGLGASAEAYQKELTSSVQSFHHGKASIKSYDAETRTLTYTLKTGKGEFTQYAASVRQTDGALMTVRGTTTRAMGVFESIGKKIKEYSYYFTGSMMIYRVIAWVREGITAVKDIDTALTELKKVTDETEASYDKFLKTAEKTASKVGSTVKDVVSSTADWARLGYAMEEAHELATSTQILMNVSEFDDVSKATDTLISSVQAFKYTAEESMDVVDILNTIGNNYAISTADLATSLTKSSGSLVAANGTLEEAVALTATANTIIQDADVVGK